MYELTSSLRRDTLPSVRGREKEKVDLNVTNLNEEPSGGIASCEQFGLALFSW